MEVINVAVFVGSLRRDSFSRKLANALIALAPPGLNLEIVEIGALPLYNQVFDDHGSVPEAYPAFRERVKSAGAVLFVTPEYNRSVPAALKNALDVASRPRGANCWDAKPGAVVSVSPGAMGAFGANHHLRQSLVFLNVLAMQQPEAYIGGVATLLDEKGAIEKDSTREFLRSFLASFAAWIAMVQPPKS